MTRSQMSKKIRQVVAKTKAHKDTFAVPEFMRILQDALEQQPEKSSRATETVLHFVEMATKALAPSPIYSPALMRSLYRHVLDMADELGIPREPLLEDLLFQSLRRTEGAAKPRRTRSKNAKSAILQAALDEFSDRGYHATTIDTIAARAGIAKGTVYRYFKTKQELFNVLKENTLSEFERMAREDLTKEKDALRLIESVIHIYLNFFENNSAFFKVIIQEQQDFGREFSEKFINELILALPGLKRSCWKAARSGRLKQMNYFTVFFGIVGFLNGVIQKWLHEGAEGSLLSEAEAVKEVLFYGIVAAGRTDGRMHELKVIS